MKWRLSESGLSILEGDRLVARYPGRTSPIDHKHFAQWSRDAALVCQIYNDFVEKNQVFKFHPAIEHIGERPKLANDEDAGYDLVATKDGSALPGRPTLVKTGFAMALPPDTVAFVCSRSGLALKRGVFVLNAPGVIDSPYRGEIGVILFNTGDEPFDFKAGDRIAQLVFLPVYHPIFVEVADLPETNRGAGGFGSSGT